MLQLFVSLLFVFMLIGCSEEAPQQVEQKNTKETPAMKANKALPAKNTKAFTVQNAKAWKPFKGNTVNIEKDGTVLLASSLNNPKSSVTTQGAYVVVPLAQVKDYSDKTVQITVIAAKAKENGSAEFAVAYSTAEVGNSGWKKFTPGEKFASYSFKYKIPTCKECKPDFIGVWADTKGSNKGLLVKSVSVTTLN
jgi:hypothetical protein